MVVGVVVVVWSCVCQGQDAGAGGATGGGSQHKQHGAQLTK